MLTKSLMLACAVLLLLTGRIPVEAAEGVEAFLRLDGVQGGALDSKHKDEMEILSWYLAEPLDTQRPGRKRLELTITKKLDRSSPRFFQAFATGEHLREGKLSLFRTGPSGAAEFLRYRLLELRVTSYSIGGTDSMPVETVVLSFGKSEMEYRPVNGDGSPGHPVTSRFE